MNGEKYEDLNIEYLRSLATNEVALYRDIDFLRSMAFPEDENLFMAKECVKVARKSFLGWFKKLERLAQGEIHLRRVKDFPDITFIYKGKQELIKKYHDKLVDVIEGKIEYKVVNNKVSDEVDVGEVILECRRTKSGGYTTMNGEKFDVQGNHWKERRIVRIGDEFEVIDISNRGNHRCSKVQVVSINPVQFLVERKGFYKRCEICQK